MLMTHKMRSALVASALCGQGQVRRRSCPQPSIPAVLQLQPNLHERTDPKAKEFCFPRPGATAIQQPPSHQQPQ
jgi:hypothetical protein